MTETKKTATVEAEDTKTPAAENEKAAEVKAAAERMEKKVKEAVMEVRKTGTTVKEAAEKKAEEVKDTVKKEAAKKEDAKKEAKETAKRETTKRAPRTRHSAKAEKEEKAAEVQEAVILQYAGKEVVYADLVKRAEAIWTEKGRKAEALKDVKVYVKPEENMAYYVMNNGEEIGGFAI